MTITTAAHMTNQENQQAIHPEYMLEEIHLVRENERRRLSIEIHDGVAQWMIGTLYHIKACRSNLSQTNTERLSSELTDIEKTLQKSVRELRRIIADLRPFPLEELGLIPAIQQITTILKEENIKCWFEVDGVLPKLTPAEERVTFGIIRESLTNIRKHAQATSVNIRIRLHNHAVSVKISDNGVGFNPGNISNNPAMPSHVGILGMKDTAALIGAYLNISSKPDMGTSVELSFTPASGQSLQMAGER